MDNKNSKLESAYNPKIIEQELYDYWENKGYFKPHGNTRKESFCIITPPPNITGNLHMGHAFQKTIIDILIRYRRMQGKNTLWQSGTDHAGIATQMVVERAISKEEGKTRHDYGRDAFINKIWEWKSEYGNNITHQMKRLGSSVDWARDRFTMDAGLSNSVREVFVRLYQEDLIYRGKRLVNWDPKLCTAISDLEVENRESIGFMWHLRYPLANGAKTDSGKDYLVVATTRPETVLGDTGIAINPEDARYRSLIGQEIILPLVGVKIRIIADKYTDMKKGTGCVKITPAHDFNDYELAKRHGLLMINIMTSSGIIRQEAEVFNTLGEVCTNYRRIIPPQYHGMDRFAARKEIIDAFSKLGLLDQIKSHTLTLPFGDRSGVIIEPMLTDQWYVRTGQIAKVAVEAVKLGRIRFVQKQYENMYFSWMGNIQDWCISRQLWWGHRIPAWYNTNGQVYVGRTEEEVRREYHLDADLVLTQDEDVLDTWFSSSLWTFSSLGWPNQTDALKIFHPSTVIVSGFDIIFFWIARMIMMTMHFVKDENGKPQVPFNTVYLTGLIRDDEGKKMSKSNGNVIDPLDMIDGISLKGLLKKRIKNVMQPQFIEKIRTRTEKQFPRGIEAHGTDALRFTLAALASTGRDINWDMNRLGGYRNFCTKLWNASRFVLINAEQNNCDFSDGKRVLSVADRWILAEFNDTVKDYRNALDTYRFDLAANILYEFTWNKFCDWYLEITKVAIRKGSDPEQRGGRHTMISVLESLLRLAHPIIPFITETIWQRTYRLRHTTTILGQRESIMVQPFPEYDTKLEDPDSLSDMKCLKEIVTSIRNIRAEMNIASNKPLTALLRNADGNTQRIIKKNNIFIIHLGRLKSISLVSSLKKIPPSITKLISGAELLIPMLDFIDKKTEILRLDKEIEKLNLKIMLIEKRLDATDFRVRAPESIVTKEQDRLSIYKEQKMQLKNQKETIFSL